MSNVYNILYKDNTHGYSHDIIRMAELNAKKEMDRIVW